MRKIALAFAGLCLIFTTTPASALQPEQTRTGVKVCRVDQTAVLHWQIWGKVVDIYMTPFYDQGMEIRFKTFGIHKGSTKSWVGYSTYYWKVHTPPYNYIQNAWTTCR